MNWKRLSAVAIGLATTAALVGSSLAALPDDREQTMKHVGKAFKALVTMSKGTFDAAEAKTQGNEIAAQLEKFKTLFPAGSENTGDKQASPKIWTDAAGFETARTNAMTAALAVASVTDAAAFPAAFKTLGGTCKACHDKYRKED